MSHKIYKVHTNSDYTADITFFDGTVKKYDCRILIESFPEYREVIADENTFSRVSVKKDCDGLRWENGVGLEADAVWNGGIEMGIEKITEPEYMYAALIQKMRETCGMSQKALSDKSGISQADISRIERAQANPSIKTMSRLTKAMGHRLMVSTEAQTDELFYPNGAIGGHTVAEIEAMPQDVWMELINGELYDMASPSSDHQAVISEIHYQFMDQIKKNSGKCKVFEAPTGVWFADDERNYVIPDLSVVCDRSKIEKKGIVGAPDFILEVLSPSTYKKDLTVKLNLYREKGVREYWLIDTDKKRLIVYADDGLCMPQIHTFEETAEVSVLSGNIRIDLRELLN